MLQKEGFVIKKRLLLVLLCCFLLPGPVQAEEQAETSPLDWQISVLKKPTAEDLERQRWSYVFANDIGRYAFDNKSLRKDEADKKLVYVLVKTIFTDPEVIGKLTEKYKQQLPANDKVAYSEMQMVFQVRGKKYAVTESRVFSEQGTLLEETKKSAKFAAVTPKTFADSMYDIARNYEKNN
ncbi:hypothetical protein [Sporomusa termitida]|uniref:Uncharacterized protein n=1 Tax=Sporomusa termitida TaxID=2377 RepID=A0A517DYB1_9FIRM|nr:hypothetical protein [Sporomusa termitida]QDR82226.1 hypothetical protein SPTER_36500 [Sporomusa termitida]